MDIKKAEEKLVEMDSLLTTLTKVIRKHWIILTFIILGAGVYCIWNMPDEATDEDTEQIDETLK